MSKLASIEIIKKIYPHPNADKVEFAEVLGFKCIVPKQTFIENQRVVLIQPDTILPDNTEWAAPYKKRSKRVKALKFRGEWSFGIVESLDILPSYKYEVGEEVSEVLGVRKYTAPQPQHLNAKGRLPHGLSKTDETNYQNIDLDRVEGELVDVTLKIDGQSCTFYYKRATEDENATFGVTGRNLELKLDSTNNYTAHIARYDIENKLAAFCEENKVNLAIRGESYGTGIQGHKANPHSKKDKGFIIFSIYNLDTFQYERKGSSLYFPQVAEALGIPYVPVLESDVSLTPALIKKYAEDTKTLPNGQKFEGVVINHSEGSFKIINLHYDSKK